MGTRERRAAQEGRREAAFEQALDRSRWRGGGWRPVALSGLRWRRVETDLDADARAGTVGRLLIPAFLLVLVGVTELARLTISAFADGRTVLGAGGLVAGAGAVVVTAGIVRVVQTWEPRRSGTFISTRGVRLVGDRDVWTMVPWSAIGGFVERLPDREQSGAASEAGVDLVIGPAGAVIFEPEREVAVAAGTLVALVGIATDERRPARSAAALARHLEGLRHSAPSR